MEEGKGARYLASGRQFGNALLGVRHQEEEDDQPTCSTCGHPLTVRHILLDCIDLQDVRDRHTSLLLVSSKICLKLLTIALLLILSKMFVVIVYCSISPYIFRSFYLSLS